jgi:hypothetical protein
VHLPRRGADRAGCRHHHHRRSIEARRGISEAHGKGAYEWFDYSRLNDKQQDVIVLIMHRLHEGVLVGHAGAGGLGSRPPSGDCLS